MKNYDIRIRSMDRINAIIKTYSKNVSQMHYITHFILDLLKSLNFRSTLIRNRLTLNEYQDCQLQKYPLAYSIHLKICIVLNINSISILMLLSNWRKISNQPQTKDKPQV